MLASNDFYDENEDIYSGWDLIRNEIPKIVRQNAFNIYEEITGYDDIYRSLDNLNLNNNNIIIDTVPTVSVKINILNEEKIKLILNVD